MNSFILSICLLTPSASPAEFDDAILPLFKVRCVRCHGSIKPKAGLNLSTPAGLARGGESGAAISGGLDESLLWQRISDDEMPPDKPLPAAEKEILRKWIAGGAVGLPAAAKGSADHWAFRTLENPRPPVVRDASRVRTSIDRFVQARLEKQSLTLSPDASPAALIRRIAFDLTGLPATLDEMEEFLADSAPDAYERMVERYLASPRFGERWGKHWLDAAGYADSNGYFSADTDRPLAYRYRDYVIRSLNADKPFDRFICEQLAGDELAPLFRSGQPTTAEAIELLEATHFLRNGQDGTDIGIQEPEAFEIDRRAALEAVVQVTASSLLGLTLHCARCHDHKFEPITQKEYYQFQAIMFPAFNPQDWVNPKDRTIYAYLPGEKEAWEENERRIKAELAQLRVESMQWLADHREPAKLLVHDKFDDDSWQTRWSSTAPGDDHPGGQLTLGGASPNAARVVDGALQVIAGPAEAWLSTTTNFDWTPDEKDSWIQATFELVDNKVGGGPAERIGYTLAAHDFDDTSSTDGGNLLIDGNPTTVTNIYRDYPGADQKPIGAIGGEGYVPGRNYGVRITNIGDGKFRLEHVVDGHSDGKSHELAASDLPDGGFAFFFCAGRSYVVDDFRVERSLVDAGSPSDLAELRKQIAARRQEYGQRRRQLEEKRQKEPGRAIAWVTDKSAKPPVVPLLTRGLYHLRGENVEPGVLRFLTEGDQDRNPTEGPPDGFRPQPPTSDAVTTGRRLALAEWLTREGGRPAALVARVHANRMWRQYFGRGIVATTDNLGQGGSPPANTELLEHLAGALVAGGWSQKSLHRKIVRSTVYRQSSAPRAEGLAADPDNRLLWRWPVRRLEAEVIRDGMLAVAGELDPLRFGPYVPTKQTPVGEVIVDESVAGARRRSVYLQQRRSQTLSLLKVFDAPAVATVCTARPSSTVPLQSLALLNSDFAVARGEAFAARLRAETGGSKSSDRVRQAWRIAIGHDPTPAENALGVEFLATQQAQYSGTDAAERALADFCQMLLASNWFLYLE